MKKIISALILSTSLVSVAQAADDTRRQYIGGGVQYGQLSTDGRSEDRTTLMFQGRLGFNLDRNWVLELEAGISPESEKTVSQVCIDGDVTLLNPNGYDLVCDYADRFSRQSVRLNLMYRYPLVGSLDLFAALGLGAVRTDYDFEFTSATYGDTTYTADEVNTNLGYFNFISSSDNDLALADVGETTGSSVDFAYALEVGTVIDDQHRIGLSYVPEYGESDIGTFSYIGVSYAWLYRFDAF